MDHGRNLVVVMAMGMPVLEALPLAGLNMPDHVAWLKEDLASLLVKATEDFERVQDVSLWMEWLTTTPSE